MIGLGKVHGEVLSYLMHPNVDYKEISLGSSSWRSSVPLFSCLFLALRIGPRLAHVDKCATTEPGPQSPGQSTACCVGLKTGMAVKRFKRRCVPSFLG